MISLYNFSSVFLNAITTVRGKVTALSHTTQKHNATENSKNLQISLSIADLHVTDIYRSYNTALLRKRCIGEKLPQNGTVW